MGKIKQGILGGFSGKVAGVVGSSWKGIAVIKSLPLSVANPKTAGQVAQRSKFSAATKMGSQLLSTIVKPLWDRFAQQASGYNDFVSANVAAFNDAGEVDTDALIMSRGSLGGEVIVSADADTGTPEATIIWVDNSGDGNKLATDEVYVTIVAENGNFAQGFATGAVRSDQTVEVVSIANFPAPGIFEIYLSFRRVDGTIVSDSTRLPLDIS